jgi:hypothetical protein
LLYPPELRALGEVKVKVKEVKIGIGGSPANYSLPPDPQP